MNDQAVMGSTTPTNGILLMTPSPSGPVFSELARDGDDQHKGICVIEGCGGTIFERTIPVVHPTTGVRSTSADCYCTKGGWKHKFHRVP